MESLQAHRELKENLYIRGKYIKYLQTGRVNHVHLIPTWVLKRETQLEDIYIYYERRESPGVS